MIKLNYFFIILALFSVLLFSGCICFVGNCDGDNGHDDLQFFKGIPTAKIPDACLESKEDVCGLFSCMVDQCWCSAAYPSAVLQEGNTVIDNEEQAISVVTQYLQNNGLGNYTVEKAVKLNNIFWNVFAYNADNDEKVFTLAVDGTIIETVCGV